MDRSRGDPRVGSKRSFEDFDSDEARRSERVMTHKYRGSQQSSREVKPKFIDTTQGEPKNICKP
jgi:hypothetical protein